jgi:hypothetical protein
VLVVLIEEFDGVGGGGHGRDLVLVVVEENEKEERRTGKKKRGRERRKEEDRGKNVISHEPSKLNRCHVTNYPPPQQIFVIRMKSQMINNYRDEMGGLVSSRTKIQMAYNYRDEKHILPLIFLRALN